MSIKTKLLEACVVHVNKRIANYNDEDEILKDAVDSNVTSSDVNGDSGMEKLLNALEKNGQYLNDAHKMMATLKLIDPKVRKDYVALGSLVTTNTTNFFIAISLGKLDIDDTSYFVISKGSPIGEQLLHKTVGNSINFNGTSYTITAIN